MDEKSGSVENVDYLSHYVLSLESSIKNSMFGGQEPQIVIQKRNKKFSHGDFLIIPKGKTHRLEETETHVSLDKLKVLTKQLIPVAVKSIDENPDGSYALKLNRADLFATVIYDVLQRKDNFGRLQDKHKSRVIINTGFLQDAELAISNNERDVTLSHLRSLLLSMHTAALLEANGYQADHLSYNTLPSQCKRLADLLGIPLTSFHHKDEPKSNFIEAISNSLLTCPYYVVENNDSIGKNKDAAGHMDKQNVKDNCNSKRCLNLRNFAKDANLPVGGKNGYDPNIHVVDFSESSSRFRQLCSLEYNLESHSKWKPDICVHIASYEQSFNQQAVDLAWQALSKHMSKIRQVHLSAGAVSARKASTSAQQLPSAQEFFDLRKRQMEKSFRMKYGDKVQGDGWEATIAGLTSAVVKFDFLLTNSRSAVKLDLSSDHDHGLEKGGVFVMYNYARLATMFASFDSAVANGTYPPLPPADSLDFCCLREEEEWVLLFNYLFTFTNIVTGCVSSLKENNPKSLIHTHKICQFLVDLSRDFSTYYNRVHVLGEPRAHLLEVMFARIYLLKAVQQVMQNALALLHIEPLSQL